VDDDLAFAMTSDLPQLLKQDAIIESLLELRFEHSQVGEVVVGRLAAAQEWSDYHSQRLPFSDLPQSIRDADPIAAPADFAACKTQLALKS